MARIRTQTIIQLDDTEQEVMRAAGDTKMFNAAVRPLQNALKEAGSAVAKIGRGTPDEDDLQAGVEATERIQQILRLLPETEERLEAETAVEEAANQIREIQRMVQAH